MRILSQDGIKDMSYEQTNILCETQSAEGHNTAYIIYAQTLDNYYTIIATYSTKAKAKKSMEMLREAFNNYEWIKRTGNTKATESALSLVSNEQFNEMTSVYFQFPTDDELED